MLGKFYPETLKSLPIWVLWKLEPNAKGELTKVPYSARYHGKASSKNADSWATYAQAVQRYEEQPDLYNGIAICVSDGLLFIDLDDCIDADGVLNSTAIDITKRFKGQYIEVSQSGTGIHILTKGNIPRSFKNSKANVEMYASWRICAMTGNAISPGEPSESQDAVDYVFSKYKTPEVKTKTHRCESMPLQKDDKWIISHASGHGRFDNLYAGEWAAAGYGSQSEADLALLMILSYWTNRNAGQMDRIFRSSGLYRGKWERQDYRDRTLSMAIDFCDHTLSDYVSQKNKEKGEAYEKAMREAWDGV